VSAYLSSRVRTLVTVADLLSHESGLPPFGEDSEMAEIPNFPGDRTAHRLAFARWVLGRAPIALPKTAFHYSNAGYAVAAAISERVGKASWESLIQKRIFDRLGMKSAGFGWPSRVWGHTMGPDGRLIPVDPKGPYQLKDYIEPAGDLHMTAEDLLKFMQAHARAMRGQKTIISPAAAAVMHTKRIKSGLGFGVSSVAGLENVATHSGSADTFVTVMAFSAEHDVAVAVSTNSAAEGAEKVLGAMLKELLARYASKK